jgi:hypothetical protein
MWDPDQYLRYADQRALPFRHLVAAVGHLDPAVVVDLGCGPGGLTATLLPVLARTSHRVASRGRRSASIRWVCRELSDAGIAALC